MCSKNVPPLTLSFNCVGMCCLYSLGPGVVCSPRLVGNLVVNDNPGPSNRGRTAWSYVMLVCSALSKGAESECCNFELLLGRTNLGPGFFKACQSVVLLYWEGPGIDAVRRMWRSMLLGGRCIAIRPPLMLCLLSGKTTIAIPGSSYKEGPDLVRPFAKANVPPFFLPFAIRPANVRW